MNRICVVTSKAATYYAIVSRMRKAGLPFTSVLPGADRGDCTLIITSAGEMGQFDGLALALEDLDENPGVFKGQLLSRLNEGDDMVLVGVDPGTRIGLAVFYGETNLEYSTFGSVVGLSLRVGVFVRGVPAKRFVIKVGNGNPVMAARLIESLKLEAPEAAIEMVDESGTSVRRVRMRGIQGDQGAAAKIAFRKGEVVSPGSPRTRA
ncbi:MAG: hypothetical protein ABSB29_03510 [Nitrososphaerales archaeon]